MTGNVLQNQPLLGPARSGARRGREPPLAAGGSRRGFAGHDGRGAGPDGAELALFTTDAGGLEKAARLESIALDGPHPAILVQKGDRAGAFAAVLSRLAASGVSITAVSAISDGRGRFGCLVALPAADVARALRVLAEAAWIKED